MTTSVATSVSVNGSALTHRYGRRATGIIALEFSFDGPGAIAVTGPNGSGKSTLLRIMAGLLRPTEGSTGVVVSGRALAPDQRRRAIGLATPELSFYEEFTATENLCFAGETHGLPDPVRAAGQALDLVGLSPRAGDKVASYSSGMKQRLRLAFALVHEPPLLMLDEPGSHLDDAGRAAVRAVIARQAERGLVLIATNDPQEIQLAERALALHGRGLGDPS